MREIKFRWYNAKHKKWLYWFYFENRWDWYITKWDLLDNPFSTPYDFKIERWSISQYTGLKDKNGEEIYEWDIVEWKQTEWWILESNIDTKVHICKIDWFMNWWACRLNDEHCWFTLWSSHMTIIWNIYESPEIISNL